MSHDPSRRLATAEEIMNGNSPFETVDTPLGTMERWRAEALIIGTTSGIQDVYRTIRDDAAAQAARADATEARNALIQHLCAKVDAFESKLDDLVAQVAAEREARRADEARAREFDEEPLSLPPGDPPDPSVIRDAETHQPGGELHAIAAKTEEEEEPSELPEPPLETEADAGKVPLSYGNVPMSYIKGAPKDATSRDQALPRRAEQAGDLPEGLVEEPLEVPAPKGSVVPQPTAVSLNSR
jgi:hypothetical protein